MKNLLLLSILLFLFFQSANGQTIYAVQDGDWDDPGTWNVGGGTIPSTTDDVEINGFDVLLDEGTGDVTIKSLSLKNDQESSDTRLLVDGNIDFIVTENIQADLENFDNSIELKLSGGARLNVNQSVQFTRFADNNTDKKLKLRMSDNSEMTVDQDFTFDYKSSKSDEAHHEFHLSHTSILRVKGITNFLMSGGNDFYIKADNSSQMILENGLYLVKSGGGTFRVELEYKLNIIGYLSVMHSGGSGSVSFTATSDSSYIGATGDVALTSSGPSEISFTASDDGSVFNFRRNININSTVDDMVLIELLNNSRLFVGGNISRSNNYGNLTMSNGATLIYDGDNPQILTPRTEAGNGTDVFDVKNRLLDNPTGFTLSDTLFVEEDMILSEGIVVTDSLNPIVISDEVEILGGSENAYISGPVIKRGRSAAAFVFPIGNSAKYAPITVGRITNAETEFKAEFRGDPPPFGVFESGKVEGISTKEYWRLKQSTDKENLPVTLYWADAEASGITDTTNLIVVGRNSANGEWESYGKSFVTGGTGSGTSGSIQSKKGDPPPFGVFEFTFGSSTSGNALPVELSKFDAIKQDAEVQLVWETASEVNTRHFELERSFDGITYNSIGTIAASGNSYDRKNYIFNDKAPVYGDNYYRLKILDNDGTFEHSSVEVINFELIAFLTVSPNPIRNELRVKGPDDSYEEAIMEVFDQSGRLIYRGAFNFENGYFQIDTNNINVTISGTYFLRISGATETKSLKFMKLE